MPESVLEQEIPAPAGILLKHLFTHAGSLPGQGRLRRDVYLGGSRLCAGAPRLVPSLLSR